MNAEELKMERLRLANATNHGGPNASKAVVDAAAAYYAFVTSAAVVPAKSKKKRAR